MSDACYVRYLHDVAGIASKERVHVLYVCKDRGHGLTWNGYEIGSMQMRTHQDVTNAMPYMLL